MVKRYAKTCHLKEDPESIAMYIREHARVWPEVLTAIRTVGVIEMAIFVSHPRPSPPTPVRVACAVHCAACSSARLLRSRAVLNILHAAAVAAVARGNALVVCFVDASLWTGSLL